MFITNKVRILWLGAVSNCLIALLLSFVSLKAFSQEINRYEGPYSVGDSLSGNSTYDYFIDNEQADTVFHGNFRFSASFQDTSDRKQTNQLFFDGNFQNNLKNGSWIYRYNQFRSVDNPRIEDRVITYDVDGEEYTVKGFFKNGKAEGKWHVLKQRVKSSSPQDTILNVNAEYSSGNMSGGLEAYKKNVSVKGEFDENGLLDGKWEFIYTLKKDKQLKEYRIYEQGVFLEHYFRLGNEKFEVSQIGLDVTKENKDEIWEELPLGAKYFRIIYHTNFGLKNGDKHTLTSDSTRDFIERSNRFLEETLFSFGKQQNLHFWQLLKGSDTLNYAKFKVRKFPFRDQEKTGLADSRKKLDDIKYIIQEFLADAQVNVSRHSYKELALYYQVMQVYKRQLPSFDKFISKLEDSVYHYINREQIYPYIAPEAAYPDKIQYNFKDEQLAEIFDFPEEISPESCDIANVHEHIGEIHEDVVMMRDSTARIIEKYKKESRLKSNEDKIVDRKDSILSLYNKENPSAKLNNFHKEAADPIRKYTEDKFTYYAELELDDKINVIDSLLACYDEVLELYKVQANLPDQIKLLDEMYTNTVWNPYYLVDMDERMKERVYKAYENILLPYLHDHVKSSIECGRVKAIANNYKILFDRMKEIKEQDTKKEERLLRRTNDVEKVLEILNIEFEKI